MERPDAIELVPNPVPAVSIGLICPVQPTADPAFRDAKRRSSSTYLRHLAFAGLSCGPFGAPRLMAR